MEIGKIIKEKRTAKKMTQEELANKCFVSRPLISKWENGRSYPDLEQLLNLSDFFDIPLDELMRGDKKMIKEKDKQIILWKRVKWGILFLTAVIIACIGYTFWWNSTNSNQISRLENKIQWTGYQDGEYFLDKDDIRISVSRIPTEFPNPLFKPYRVSVKKENLLIRSNDLNVFEFYNGKGLSFNLDSNLKLLKENKFEKSKGQADTFLKENRPSIENLINLEKEYYSIIN